MASSIGTAWIQIKPSLKGISKDIEEQLGGDLDRALGKSDGAFGKFSKNSIAALDKIGKFGFGALAAVSATTVAYIGSRIDDAVKRVDTLLSFPRVLQAMGATSEDAKNSTDKLSKSLQGLPTALQAGAAGVQQLVVAGLKVPEATDAFLALNNALLSSGAGAAQIDSAMLAISQSLSRGRIEGQEWSSLLATMPTAFGALQKATGKSTGELKELFRLDPQGLLDRIVDLNTNGGEGFASLETQAREATGGIGTAFSNLGNSVDRGWQSLITAVGGGDLESGAKKISDVITTVGSNIEGVMKSIGEWIGNNGPLIDNILIPALTGVAVAIGLITAGFILMSLLNPVNLIVAGVVLLAAGIAIVVKHWDTLVGAIAKFFVDIWGKITSIFTKVGTAIGDAIGGALKSTVNTVLGWVEGFVNKVIKLINSAIGFINKIPGVEIGVIPTVQFGRMATGGPVIGPGTDTSDSIPTLLSNNEYVIRAAAAKKIGRENLDELNSTGSLSGGGGDVYNIYPPKEFAGDYDTLAEYISKKIALKKARVIGG